MEVEAASRNPFRGAAPFAPHRRGLGAETARDQVDAVAARRPARHLPQLGRHEHAPAIEAERGGQRLEEIGEAAIAIARREARIDRDHAGEVGDRLFGARGDERERPVERRPIGGSGEADAHLFQDLFNCYILYRNRLEGSPLAS